MGLHHVLFCHMVSQVGGQLSFLVLTCCVQSFFFYCCCFVFCLFLLGSPCSVQLISIKEWGDTALGMSKPHPLISIFQPMLLALAKGWMGT